PLAEVPRAARVPARAHHRAGVGDRPRVPGARREDPAPAAAVARDRMNDVREQQAPLAEAREDESSRALQGWLEGAPLADPAEVLRALKQVAALRTEAAADLLNRAATEDALLG